MSSQAFDIHEMHTKLIVINFKIKVTLPIYTENT